MSLVGATLDPMVNVLPGRKSQFNCRLSLRRTGERAAYLLDFPGRLP
jgi:hypothetical protein